MYNNRDKFKERVVMASGIYAEIKKRILDAEYGAVFVTSDFIYVRVNNIGSRGYKNTWKRAN